MPNPALAIHPAHAALAAEVAALREELAGLLAEVDELVEFVRPNLLALYQVRLGPSELVLLAARFELARLKRAIDLAQAALNTGQTPDPGRIEEALEREAEEWKVRLDAAAKKLKAAAEHLKGLLSKEESAELRMLYLVLVKKLHPDLHPDLSDDEKKLWHKVQEANRLNDLPGMKALVALMEGKLAPKETPAMDALEREKKVVAKHVETQRKKIATIRAEPPFTMERELNDEAWVKARCAALSAETEGLRREAEGLKPHLELLMAGTDGDGSKVH
ncbi:MAG: hypothetical protein ACM3SU_15445 [Acidobacteriota bacterium]